MPPGFPAGVCALVGSAPRASTRTESTARRAKFALLCATIGFTFRLMTLRRSSLGADKAKGDGAVPRHRTVPSHLNGSGTKPNSPVLLQLFLFDAIPGYANEDGNPVLILDQQPDLSRSKIQGPAIADEAQKLRLTRPQRRLSLRERHPRHRAPPSRCGFGHRRSGSGRHDSAVTATG